MLIVFILKTTCLEERGGVKKYVFSFFIVLDLLRWNMIHGVKKLHMQNAVNNYEVFCWLKNGRSGYIFLIQKLFLLFDWFYLWSLILINFLFLIFPSFELPLYIDLYLSSFWSFSAFFLSFFNYEFYHVVCLSDIHII